MRGQSAARVQDRTDRLMAQPRGDLEKALEFGDQQQITPLSLPSAAIAQRNIFNTMDKEDLREERARKSIYADWHTDSTLPEYWSTDWNEWELTHFWEERALDGKLKIDKLFKETWQVPGTIKPLAYMVSTGGLYFLFTAGGRYYFWADRQLTIHSMQFASPQEFVHYALKADGSEDGSHMPDVKIQQIPDTDFSWWSH